MVGLSGRGSATRTGNARVHEKAKPFTLVKNSTLMVATLKFRLFAPCVLAKLDVVAARTQEKFDLQDLVHGRITCSSFSQAVSHSPVQRLVLINSSWLKACQALLSGLLSKTLFRFVESIDLA